MDRSRYDSAMFWLPFGTAAAVIGLALMTIGVTRQASSQSVWSSAWFDAGLAVLIVGVLLLVWSLALFLTRRREESVPAPTDKTPADGPKRKGPDWMTEAVRGYYRERENLFKSRERDSKKKKS